MSIDAASHDGERVRAGAPVSSSCARVLGDNQLAGSHALAVDYVVMLEALGVRFSAISAGRLHIEAPPRVLTPELRAEIAAHKAELLAALVAEAGQSSLMDSRDLSASPDAPGLLNPTDPTALELAAAELPSPLTSPAPAAELPAEPARPLAAVRCPSPTARLVAALRAGFAARCSSCRGYLRRSPDRYVPACACPPCGACGWHPDLCECADPAAAGRGSFLRGLSPGRPRERVIDANSVCFPAPRHAAILENARRELERAGEATTLTHRNDVAVWEHIARHLERPEAHRP